jgi:hypothetical protein
MAARDKYHAQVRRALEKDGWTITKDPYVLQFEGFNYPIDLGAEKLFAAEKGQEKIAVEIKCFLAESIPNEFHTALGQYLDYAIGLEDQEPERVLFLAIPDKIYKKFSKTPFLLKVLDRFKVKVITFDAETETIIQWLKI